jgi:hypothetical protein
MVNKPCALVLVHGFNGSERSFESFPIHLTERLADLYPLTVCPFPSYSTEESHEMIRNRLRDFLRTILTTHEGIILMAHSMGGLLVADTFLENLSLKIWAILTFDTPFYGLHHQVFSNAAGDKAYAILSNILTETKDVHDSAVQALTLHSQNVWQSIQSKSWFGSNEQRLIEETETSQESIQTTKETESNAIQEPMEFTNGDEIKGLYIESHAQNSDESNPWITLGITSAAVAAGLYFSGAGALMYSLIRSPWVRNVTTAIAIHHAKNAGRSISFLYPMWQNKDQLHSRMKNLVKLTENRHIFLKCYYIQVIHSTIQLQVTAQRA